MELDRPLAEDRVLVAGTATRSVVADRARWKLVVVERGDVPAAAFTRCGERLDALTRGLREALGERAEVRTGALSVRPEHDREGRQLPEVRVSGEVTVEVPLADAGDAAGAAMSAGADHLAGPALEVGDSTAVVEELYGEAVGAARRKAERIAAAAGRRLGRVLSVAEDSDIVPMARYRSGTAMSAGGPELEPADAELAATVAVLFALED